ncbi:MAG: hypothetical protein QNJ09_02290 [Paracoccaceae bacterium]|nr:hypothetical protein [Paracoccaceae bacterium]
MTMATSAAPAAAKTAKTDLDLERALYLSVAVFLTMVVTAVITWGLPALAMTALALVPLVMTVLVLITVGK